MTVATPISLDHLFRAQFGEDRVLWQVFRQRPAGFFVEVGAYDGVTLSNTFFLEQMGWRGILIEPIPELAQRAAQSRPRSRVVQGACSRSGSSGTATFTVAKNVPVLSYLSADEGHVQRCRDEGAELVPIEVPVFALDDVLLSERTSAPPALSPWRHSGGWEVDLVSIDTEGAEMDVLGGFNLDRFRPAVLVIENDRPAGSEIEPYLESRGYRKFHRQKINDFYYRIDRASELQTKTLHIPA